MKTNILKISLVVAISFLSLAACDKHGKKSEDAAAADSTNAAVVAAPAATAPAAAAPTTTTSTAPASGGDASGGKKAWKLACADDIKKYCADADKPGKCLKQHASELSQACSSAREAARAAHRAEKDK